MASQVITYADAHTITVEPQGNYELKSGVLNALKSGEYVTYNLDFDGDNLVLTNWSPQTEEIDRGSTANLQITAEYVDDSITIEWTDSTEYTVSIV